MQDFFRGWSRKLGLVTLLMACGLGAMWVRSFIVFDYIEIPVGRSASLFLVAYHHSVVVFSEFDPEIGVSSRNVKWYSSPTAKLTSAEITEINYDSMHSLIKYRNHPPVVPNAPNQPIRVPVLSPYYWLIGMPFSYALAIPLVVISAFLLLTKLRKGAELKTVEIRPAD